MGASMWFRSSVFGLKVQDNSMQQQQPNAGRRFGQSRLESQVDAAAKHSLRRGTKTGKETPAKISLTKYRKAFSRRNRIILWIRKCAAVTIQKHYRGHLAKRVFQGLKGLVRLQAMARGYIVRKKSEELMVRFESLFLAQARAKLLRTQTLHLSHPKCNISSSFDTSNQPTGHNHLAQSNSYGEIQPVVNFNTKEANTLGTTPITSPVMYYSSSDDSDFNNNQRRLCSVPKQRKKKQPKSKRHLVFDKTPPSP